jgi:squalene synthase HpnC
VASWLVPRSLRPHFYAVYAYCRWADDLADEVVDPARSLALLDWWSAQLDDCYQGRATHPVFLALGETIREFSIPAEPFRSLLVAFRQDQHTTRYSTFDELLGYCRHSADPVGRLVLYLGRCHDAERGTLSDRVCTGLQLANFWQDLARDFDRGRVYLPEATRRQFGYDDRMLAAREENEPFRRALAFEVTRAEGYLRAGEALVPQLPAPLRGQVWLFMQGGLKILEHIRRADYRVWSRRPTVTRSQQLGLLAGCLWRRLPLPAPLRGTRSLPRAVQEGAVSKGAVSNGVEP